VTETLVAISFLRRFNNDCFATSKAAGKHDNNFTALKAKLINKPFVRKKKTFGLVSQ
jgi:hypothetical protein